MASQSRAKRRTCTFQNVALASIASVGIICWALLLMRHGHLDTLFAQDVEAQSDYVRHLTQHRQIVESDDDYVDDVDLEAKMNVVFDEADNTVADANPAPQAASVTAASSKGAQRRLAPVPQDYYKLSPGFCTSCCNDGYQYCTCFDVEACARTVRHDGRYAFVLSHFGQPNARFKLLPFVSSMRAQATKYSGIAIDIILLITAKDLEGFSKQHRRMMEDNHVKIVYVDWNVPPGMVYQGESEWSHFMPSPDGERWCGPQDLMRLHAFTLTDYDAVAYWDSDIEFQGDVLPIFRCASSGRFITTGGGIGVPLNVGFFAVRPDPRLMQASLVFARDKENNFSKETGWGRSGFLPSKLKYAGAECGQGFMHTLFYKKESVTARKALEAAGLAEKGAFHAVQIDKCVWNYQTSFQCPENYNCSNVRAHHKPKKRGKNPKECMKSGFRDAPGTLIT